MESIYEIIHIWTAVVDKSEKWSSQWIFDFFFKKKPEKKIRGGHGFESLKPWFFQASSFQLIKLENSPQWSFFTFIVEYCRWCPSVVSVLCSDAINRPRSIYRYSNMAPRLSGQTATLGVVFFVSKSLLGIEGQNKLEKFAILTRKPRSHAWILIYRTWRIITQASVNIESAVDP